MDLGYKKISVTRVDRVGIITLNRPDIHNVLSFETFKEIDSAINLFETDEKIKVILLKSNCGVTKHSRIFSAGVNLKDYDKKFKLLDENPVEFEKLLKETRSLFSKIENISKPVIAGVDGLAVGGAFELILACDLIIASDEAMFSLGEVNIGLIPGYGGIDRLLKAVGKKKAFEIVVTGRKLPAQEAQVLGLVAEVYNTMDFGKNLIEYCKLIAEKPAGVVGLLKDTIYRLSFKSVSEDVEIKNFMKVVTGEDAREGINAFLEKRTPEFK